nr:radical SAM protein [uncultured Peptostreptococcus sp.]
MNRYNIIDDKNPREIILLRSHPCRWGRCFFCDYISDNSIDEEEMISVNKKVLEDVRGLYGRLEVINSASVFELPMETLEDIRKVCVAKGIKEIFFEAYYNYRTRLDEIRDFFDGIEVSFKCGIESFDDDFRNGYLNKNISFKDAKEVASYFDNICLLVGIKGQTKEMIDRDMKLLQENFKRGCINIYVENTTPVKRDQAIVDYFRDKYSYMDDMENIEILWNNTDFGVGGE